MSALTLTRRTGLELALVGVVALVMRPVSGAAGAPDRQHALELDVPIVAENPAAVPVRVSTDHPMEPDHFIRSIEIVLATDPVPHKGTYRFSPANGRAAVSFPMRSGAGGLLRATAECSKHGRFVASKEVRIASDGCATTTEGGPRGRLGDPRLRLSRAPRAGDIIEVRTKLDHDSDTGLRLRDGRYVRERPELFVKQMQAFVDGQLVSDFQLTSAVSANPIIRFPLKVSRRGTLRVVFVNSEGQHWEVSEEMRP